jgi:signal transduction histidine kinase
MRLRIILLVVAISSLVLVSFLVPLALLLRTFAAEQATSTATIQTQWMVPLVSTLNGSSLKLAVARVNAQNKSQPVTVFLPGGPTLGPPAQRSPAVQLAAHGRSLTANVPGGVEVLVAVQGLPHGTAVIRTFVPDSKLTHGVLHAWIVLGAIGLGLLVLSVIVSAQLARSLVRPLRTLAHASEALAAGDLSARAPIEGAREVRQVSTGLNRLAVRIGELLAHERETVADLSHRLRTPLTALRIDAESLRDDEEMARVISDVDGLTAVVNEIIREARRPTDEDGAACDAAEVVRGRAAFWRALAEDQERQMMVDVTPGCLPVRASARDVAGCADILLENVFAHTPEGAAFAVRVSNRAGGGAWLVVTDEGPGFSDPDPTLRGMSSGGSTGLGLDIARRIAENSGGMLMLGHSPQGGGAVTVGLGPAASAAKSGRRHVRPRPHLPLRSRRAEDARLAAELAEWAAIAGPDLNTR